jgi:hypothetical protein
MIWVKLAFGLAVFCVLRDAIMEIINDTDRTNPRDR